MSSVYEPVCVVVEDTVWNAVALITQVLFQKKVINCSNDIVVVVVTVVDLVCTVPFPTLLH